MPTMAKLARIRPSNLVILAALPFIIYLFTMVPNYRRSFNAIIGIEEGAATLLQSFMLIAIVLVLGLTNPLLHYLKKAASGKLRLIAIASILANVGLAFFIAAGWDISALAASIVANSVDPSTSDLVVKAVTPRRLTAEAFPIIAVETGNWLWRYAVLSAVLSLPALMNMLTQSVGVLATWALRGLASLNGLLLAYFILVAHLGFASGLFTTLRAGIFAYFFAALLGLLWAGLLRLTLRHNTIKYYGVTCAAAIAASIVLFMQPQTTMVLVGSLEKSVAITRGTPKALVDTIRFGQFGVKIDGEQGLRSAATAESALKQLKDGKEVSAVFLTVDAVPVGLPELWRVSFLADNVQTPAVFLIVGGILLGLLTLSAFQHQRHPLSVSAEFFIDTVRGIPMLVIILFVGLPFSGALKDASGGAIDMPNVMRGVLAMALGYSAYLAEIFRAGIDAVPKGQIEAARTLGLSSWQLARLVVLPQALKIVIPALGNEFIAILKDTSLLSILSVRDVTQRMREFQSASFLPFAPFNSAAIIYVVLTLAAASLIATIERKYDTKHR